MIDSIIIMRFLRIQWLACLILFMSSKILFCIFALALLQVSCEPQKLPLYVGRSYDLLSGNPLSDQVDPGFQHSIFEFSYNDKDTT